MHSLYIHVPFCRRRCPYCHFAITPYRTELVDPYLNATRKEFALRNLTPPFTTIYFGGGTPSLLTPSQLATLLTLFGTAPEITLEVNPEDVTPSYVKAIHALGINRVSMGVQSFDDHQLQILERRHNAQRAKDAVHTLYSNGITNISIDLMYDLPHQTLASWQRTLNTLPQLPITHLSLYNLVIEPHSLYAKIEDRIRPHLPTDSDSLRMLQTLKNTLTDQGFRHYEISAFCKPGYRSEHNLGYWTGRPFTGIGPSAWSYHNPTRSENTRAIRPYLKKLEQNKIPTHYTETLSPQARSRELLAVRLRLKEGVPKHPLTTDTQSIIQELQKEGWLEETPTHLRLTEKGFLFYDTVATELTP